MNEDAPKKLTAKQNMILYCLQNGWVLITSSQSNIVTCATDKFHFEFGSSLFYRLVNSDYIYQELGGHFDYVLTKKGREVKTKKVVIPGWND